MMFFPENLDNNAARERAQLESRILTLAPDIARVVAVIMDAMEKLADTVAAIDRGEIFAFMHEDFDISRLDESMRQARAAREIVDEVHAHGFTTDGTIVATRAMAQIGWTVADITRYLTVMEAQFDSVEPVSREERWNGGNLPYFLSARRCDSNGPEPVLLLAADLTIASIDLTTTALEERRQSFPGHIFENWHFPVPGCIAAAEATIGAARTIQVHNADHDKSAVAWAAERVIWSLGKLLQCKLESEHTVGGLRVMTRTTDIVGNLYEEHVSVDAFQTSMKTLNFTNSLFCRLSETAEAVSRWRPGTFPELDALVSHVIGVCRSMSIFADRLLVASTGFPGTTQGGTANGILTELGLMLNALEPFIRLVQKRSVLEEVTQFLPELCGVIRKASARLEKSSVDGDDTRRNEAYWIRSACEAAEELCVASTRMHPVEVLSPVVTAAVDILSHASIRTEDE